jgi:hypothetical protein
MYARRSDGQHHLAEARQAQEMARMERKQQEQTALALQFEQFRLHSQSMQMMTCAIIGGCGYRW